MLCRLFFNQHFTETISPLWNFKEPFVFVCPKDKTSWNRCLKTILVRMEPLIHMKNGLFTFNNPSFTKSNNIMFKIIHLQHVLLKASLRQQPQLLSNPNNPELYWNSASRGRGAGGARWGGRGRMKALLAVPLAQARAGGGWRASGSTVSDVTECDVAVVTSGGAI